MHFQYARIIRYRLKLIDLELNTKWSVAHLKRAGDPASRDQFMNDSAEAVLVAFWVCCLEFVAAMTLAFQLQDFCSHPFFNKPGVYMSFEKQVYRQIKLP